MRDKNHPSGPSGLAAKVQELVAQLMEEGGFSARSLGKRSGVDDTTIGKIVRGDMVPSVDVLDRVLAGLGYEVDVAITPNPLYGIRAKARAATR